MIGRGGMAAVYRAHHPALDRYVAIKILPEFFAEEAEYRERFQQEARAIARLKNPNILEVFDFGEERGLPYLVLELVDGGTLADKLGEPMDLERVVELLQPVASALDHAHSEGILHRDVKPSNILLRRDGSPVLADFGLSMVAHSLRRITSADSVVGTPEYMSPEQCSGAAITPASDRYSLGIVAYEMLTGRVPFQADTPGPILLAHLAQPVPPTPELDGELAAHVRGALTRGLAKAPEDRYPSAGGFVAALTPAAWPRRVWGETATSGRQTDDDAPAAMPSVLVVDDNEANRELIEACLSGVDCHVTLAAGGVEALRLISSQPPDLVLLDVQMPDIDGYEVLRQIKADPSSRLIPVVMITGLAARDDRVKALELGCDDFLAKPVDRVDLVARVRSALRSKARYDALQATERAFFALVAAIESKDGFSGSHGHRVAESARFVGKRMGLPEHAIDALYRGGLLHDIGKVAVAERVFLKNGSLDDGEMEEMRKHVVIGESLVRPMRSGASLLAIVRHHHERYDGTGYPDSLRGAEIPLLARIVAVCDAFEALRDDRPHRKRRSFEEAVAILVEGAGRQWDPDVVQLFVKELATIQKLA
jgi:putative two-component system response regulator